MYVDKAKWYHRAWNVLLSGLGFPIMLVEILVLYIWEYIFLGRNEPFMMELINKWGVQERWW